MPVRLFVMLTWTTDGRLPMIRPAVAEFLRRFIPVEASRHGARLIELGIVPDHVHAVLQLPPQFDIPRLVQGLKGASARIANRDGYVTGEPLRWAAGYHLGSVSVRDLDRAIHYVRGQSERHAVKRPPAVPCAAAPDRPLTGRP